jgi:hypothetical protein
MQRRQTQGSHFNALAIDQLHCSRTDVAALRRSRARTQVLGQSASAGDVIGVGVSFKRPLQLQRVFLNDFQIALNLLFNGVDDHGFVRMRVHHNVGVSARRQIEQLNHGGNRGAHVKALRSSKLGQHFGHMLSRLIALLDHAPHHGEERFVQGLARCRHLLRNFFAISVSLYQLLQTAQLAFDARKACAQGFFLVNVNDTTHGELSACGQGQHWPLWASDLAHLGICKLCKVLGLLF